MERTILHSDLNCFYASVEMMLDPSLRGKAVAVCGSTEDRHGIVLAKSEKAKKAGVKTGMVNWEARQLCKTDPEFLRRLLGVNGLALWRYANGTDQSRVMHRDFVSPVKSIGHGITCVADLNDEEEVWKVIFALSQDIGHRLRVHELSARGVQVAVRGNDLLGAQFQCKLPCKTQLPSEIASAANRLFQERYRWSSKVRAVTVRAIDLVPQSDPDQLSIFVDTAKLERRERLEDMVEEIRSRFGKHAITYGILLGDLKMPDDGRHSVKMPGLMYQ